MVPMRQGSPVTVKARRLLAGRYLLLDYLGTFRCKGVSRIDFERGFVVIQRFAKKAHALIVPGQGEVSAGTTATFERLCTDSDGLFAVTALERSLGRLQKLIG